MLVSIVLPVKNEPYAQTLEQEIRKFLQAYNCEVLFQREEGITNAVWHGIARAKGDYIAVMDSSGSHLPHDLLMMVNHLEKSSSHDIIVGQRITNQYPVHRKIVSLACAWLTRNFLGLNLPDPLTAFIVGRKEAMQFTKFVGCKFALEIIMKTPRSRIATWHTTHRHMNGRKSKLKPVEAVYLLKHLLRLKHESFE